MENVWHHRKVADTAAKSCFVCYKPSSSVLITPDNKDYFYVCTGHLRDRNFALPTEDEAKNIAERKKKDELDREIEIIKKEYEEKMKKKKEKRKDKDGKKDGKDEKKEEEKTDAQDEMEKEDKVCQWRRMPYHITCAEVCYKDQCLDQQVGDQNGRRAENLQTAEVGTDATTP